MCVVALMSDAPYSRLGHAGYIPALTVILSYLVCSSPDVRTWLLRSLFSGLCLSTAFSMKPFLTTLSKMTLAFTHSLTCSSSLLYLSLQHLLCACMHAKSLQQCLTLCDLMDCGLPDSSVHELLQERILEWLAMPSSRGSSQPSHQTCISYVSCIGRRGLYHQSHLGSPQHLLSYDIYFIRMSAA